MPSFLIVFFITNFVIINTIKESLGYIPELFLNEFTLRYYIKLITDKVFLNSIAYSFYVAFVSTALSTVFGTYLGYALSKSTGKFTSIMFRFPIILSYIAASALIYNTYSDKGLLYHIFLLIGLKINNLDLVYNNSGVAVILLNMFKGIPFVAFSVCPIFMKTDNLFKETAKNLGCSNMMYIFKVLLPISKQAIVTSFLVIFNYNLFTYEGYYFLGPSNPISIGVLAYQTYINPNMINRALGMAINTIMIIISIAMCIIYYILVKHENEVSQYEDFK